jgi:hypothetical protein
MSGVGIFNGVEAAFWLLLAICAAAAGHRTAGFTPGRQIMLIIFLVGFGASDIWEMYSGAWWQPTSLLLLKAACLTGLIVTAALIFATRWRLAR